MSDESDQRLPEWWRRRALRHQVVFYQKKTGVVVQSWPKPRGAPKSAAQAKTQTDFTKLAAAQKDAWAVDRVAAEAIATGTQYMWRDVLGRALVGRLIEMIPAEPGAMDVANIQQLLDQISDQPGAMLMRSPTQWVALVNPTGQEIITWDPIQAMPVWGEAPESGMTELTGPVTAGPGGGSQASIITPTGVIAGSYTAANIAVNEAGQIIDAESTTPAPETSIYHPGFASGRYYSTPIGLSPSTGAMVANRIYAVLMFAPTAETWSKMCNYVVLAAAGSTAELGVYENNAGLPGALIQYAGTVSTAAGSQREVTGLTLPTNPGWIWLAQHHSGAPSMRIISSSDPAQSNILGLGGPAGGPGSYLGAIGTATYSAGSLPNPFPSPAISNVAMPLTWIGK